MVMYGIEVFVHNPDGKTQSWRRMRPTEFGEPYQWTSKEEAEHMLYVCYGKNPEIARVCEVES